MLKINEKIFKNLFNSCHIVPERKWSFSPSSALNKNFNPRNTLCMPAVKIFICRSLTKNPYFRSGTIYREKKTL